VDELDRYGRRLIEEGITPSLVLLAARGEQVVFEKAFKRDEISNLAVETSTDPIYDLASLSKPVVTALGLLLLIADGVLDPYQPVNDFFPSASPDLTMIHLATHSSGMPDWYPYYLFPEPFDRQVETHLSRARPGSQVLYSCPGYMILKRIWEQLIAPLSLNEWIWKRIFLPLELDSTFLGGDSRFIGSPRVMPTEAGNVYELQLSIRRGYTRHFGNFNWYEPISPGMTHDRNARWMGGYGGNAGLFSSAGDLLVLLNQCDPETTYLLANHRDLCGLFWKNFTPWSPAHRTFGFKRNSSLSAAAGRSMRRKAVGHHGFTGTSAWMEPEGGVRLIVLTNRIHPRVDENLNFNRIRRRLFRLMVRETVRR